MTNKNSKWFKFYFLLHFHVYNTVNRFGVDEDDSNEKVQKSYNTFVRDWMCFNKRTAGSS